MCFVAFVLRLRVLCGVVAMIVCVYFVRRVVFCVELVNVALCLLWGAGALFVLMCFFVC